LQTAWTPLIQNTVQVGWTALAAFNTPQLVEAFGDQTVIRPTLEFSMLYASSGATAILASPNVRIWQRVIDPTSNQNQPIPASANGQFQIPNNTDTVVVTGLSLGAVPRMVDCWVMKQPGGLNLWPTYVEGTLTANGFTANLNGMTDSGNYILGWLAFF
jgi:hypothetical protein